jgi:hypothetical protein
MLPVKDAMRDENQSWDRFRMFCRRDFEDFSLKLGWKRRRLVGYHVSRQRMEVCLAAE